MNRKDREAQDKQVFGTSTLEVAAALLDLARFSKQVVSTTPRATDLMATLLLEHVLRLCEAQRGALVLLMPSPPVQKPSFVSPLSNGQSAHIFARLEMSEDEVFTRLTTFSLAGKDVQRTLDEPDWVMCRLPLAFPPASQQDESDEPADSEESNQPVPLMQAFLLVGWAGAPNETQISTARREDCRIYWTLSAPSS